MLRANIYRPDDDAPHPVLLSYGPYGKELHFQEGYPDAWTRDGRTATPRWRRARPTATRRGRSATPRSGCRTATSASASTPAGGAARRATSTPTRRAALSDFHDCIEWAGAQPWSSGKVGLLGISYYAITQWLVAGAQPAASHRDDAVGGRQRLLPRHVLPRRHALPGRRRLVPPHDHAPCSTDWASAASSAPTTGELVTGPETLTDEELAANRADYGADVRAHPLDDDFHRERSAVFDRITVPFLSAGNWGGAGRHLRGNVEGFVRRPPNQKWLEIHGLEHWTEFYTDYGIGLQKRFFDHFLKGEDNGWDRQPPVMLRVRTVDGEFIDRTENEWPIAAHPVDDLAPRPRRGHPRRSDPLAAPSEASLRGAGRAGHHDDDPADDDRHRDHRTGRGHAVRLVHHDRRRHLRRCCGCSIPTVTRSSCRVPSIRTRPSVRAGYARRTANSTANSAHHGVPGTPTTNPQPLTPGERLPTRSRDLADLDHRARRLPHRPDHPRHRLRIRRRRAAAIEPLQGLEMRGVGIYTHADPSSGRPTSTVAQQPCTPDQQRPSTLLLPHIP